MLLISGKNFGSVIWTSSKASFSFYPIKFILSMLMSPRRKCIVEHLAKNGGEAEIEDIISSILDLENKERNHKSRKSVYVSLMQTHLPKLEKEGIVRYDKRLGKLYLVNVPEGFELYTETVGKYDIPWSIYYFSLSILIAAIGLYFSNISSVIVSAVFAASAAINILSQKIKIRNG